MSALAEVREPRALERRREIESSLRRLSPMLAAVDVRGRADGAGTEVTVQLDPVLVRARADQQGLADPSIEAAAASPRVREALMMCVERANRKLAAADAIVSWSIRA